MSEVMETPKLPEAEETSEESLTQKTGNKAVFWLVFAILVFLGLTITGIYFLAKPTTDTNKIRDIFIIFMALESFVIGIALIILVVQVSLLINLVNNEIRPILKNTIDTVNNLKGTAAFLSEELVSPVIKLNEYLAGLKRLLDILRPFGK